MRSKFIASKRGNAQVWYCPQINEIVVLKCLDRHLQKDFERFVFLGWLK